MAQQEGNGRSAAREGYRADSGGVGWGMVLPFLGVGLCCGGPALIAWLTSAGVAAAIGAWWSGAAPWAIGVAGVAAAALSWWRSRRREPGPVGRTTPFRSAGSRR
jgi:hypothetical protein